MPELDRRGFLAGLFGAAVVAAAGPIPAKLLALSEQEFTKVVAKAEQILINQGGVEIWCNYATGDYSFTPLPGFVPTRAESNRLASQALSQLYKEFADGLPK